MTLILLHALGAYGVARLLVMERGPYRLLERFRHFFGVVSLVDADDKQLNRYLDLMGNPMEDFPDQIATTEVGMMLLCMYCTGLWTTLLMVLLTLEEVSRFTVVDFLASYGLYVLVLGIMDGLQSAFSTREST